MKRGFTLIELMVVIAIIAILTAITAVSYASAQAKARDVERISDISKIQLALSGYFNRCDRYPNPDTRGTSGGSYITSASLLQNDGCPAGTTLGSFIGTIPTPPAGTGQAYYTYVTGTLYGVPGDYVLGTTLETKSAVSSESLTTIPSDISNANGSSGNYLTCDATVHYCVGPK